MDEEFDAGLDMSSDMDLGSDFSSDADVFGGEDFADIPDDIGEDLSGNLDLGDVSDLDSGLEDFTDSIDEDIIGTDVEDLSGDLGTDFADDSGADFADNGETDLSDIPEDITDDVQMDGMDTADLSGDVPDDTSEDTSSWDEGVSDEMPDMDEIPEDIAEFEDSVSDEDANALYIPEDVSGMELSDSTDADEMDDADIESNLVDEGTFASGDFSDDSLGMEDDVATYTLDGDDLGNDVEATTSDSLLDGNDSSSDMNGDDIQESDDALGEENDVEFAEGMDTGTETGLDTIADDSASDTDSADYSGDEDILTDQSAFADEMPGVGDGEEVKADTDAEPTPMQELSSYMNDHNYGPGDFDEYSQDPEWQRLHEAAFPDWEGRPDLGDQSGSGTEESPYEYHFPGYETHEFPETESPKVLKPDYGRPPIEEGLELEEMDSDMPQAGEEDFSPDIAPELGGENVGDAQPNVVGEDDDLTPMQELSNYMNDHNYGQDDFDEYSQDPEWQRIHEAAFPEAAAEAADASEIPDDGKYHAVPGRHGEIAPETEPYHAVPGRHGYLTPEELESEGIKVDGYDDGMEESETGAEMTPDAGSEMISGPEMLDRFGTGQLRNGSDYFVKGDNYNQFERDYYAPDDSTYTEYEIPQERDISPSLIEGIHLGKGEVEDPSIFWGQHEKGGTAESFQEIASHIPEVRERLAAGDTLDDLADDEKLSDCANIYFRNMPEVIERDGYYEFDSNGRHRVLAARALGHDIPVRVIGKRS